MQTLKPHHKVLLADSVADAKQWITENDPAYLEKYHGHCYLICDNPTGWEASIQRPNAVESCLVEEATLGFHLLAEVDSGAITTREEVTTWFERSLAYVQGRVEKSVVEKVLRDLLATQMLYETGGRLVITDIGRISAVWYYRPEDVFSWWKNLEIVADNDLWEDDHAMTWAICSAPGYNLDYIPKAQEEQVQEYMEKVIDKFPWARPELLPSDIYQQINGKMIPHTRVAAFKYDITRIFQAIRQIAKACGWQRPDGYWTLLMARFRHGASAEVAELMEVEGLGVQLVTKLSRFGIKSLSDFVSSENRHKVERLVGPKKFTAAIASARQLLRTQLTS